MAAVRNVNKLSVVRCLSLYLRVDVDPVAEKVKSRMYMNLGELFQILSTCILFRNISSTNAELIPTYLRFFILFN